MPRNSESPMMYMFLIEFVFANCMYETPTAADMPKKNRLEHKMNTIMLRPYIFIDARTLKKENSDSPTIPNKIQKIAAKIGNGIDAKKAPNFPA